MKALRQLTIIAIALAATLAVTVSVADAPKSVTAPDRHSIEAKGKVNLYRVQAEGMRLGEGKNITDAELFFSLDSNPNMVYSVELKEKSPASNRVMAETLRDAYINKLTVTIYHQISIKKDNNLKVLMVQLN